MLDAGSSMLDVECHPEGIFAVVGKNIAFYMRCVIWDDIYNLNRILKSWEEL
jgi:hypothetical protein